MCGISGVFSVNRVNSQLVEKSIEKIAHRGPDERGFLIDSHCVLGMCRLSIIDVKSGQQPNFNSERSIVSVFNGEIYNFMELRSLLESRGYGFLGKGDSALIPYLFQEFGKEFPKYLQGMFAIAIYDKPKSRLILVRDRLGKKPLWYMHSRTSVSFSSELKGLLELDVPRVFDTEVIPEYLQYGYINAPRSMFKGIEQIEPGHIVIFEPDRRSVEKYWDTSDLKPLEITFDEAKKEATRLIRDSVKSRLVSERPVGAFLSGGIDSTIVTALMKQESSSPVHTYTIGFDNARFDESSYARAVAQALGTQHHERVVLANPKLVIENLSRVLDQPFADSSIIPTFLLSEFAREEVVVALSGDGGDEGFAGYERYRAGWLLDSLNPLLVLNPMSFIPWGRKLNPKLRKLLKHSKFQSLEERYRGFQSLFQSNDLKRILNPDLLKLGNSDFFHQMWKELPDVDKLRKMQQIDLKSYLPGDLMYKVDIASMANSLEVRSPLLDYRVVEFGLSLPRRFKIKGGESKFILREIARDLVPRVLIDRPKMGFGIPRAHWLRHEFEGVVKEVLLDQRSRARGWYEFKEVEKTIDRHRKGEDLDSLIWPMFMLELWAKNWLD